MPRFPHPARLSYRLLRFFSLMTLLATVAQAGGARAALTSLHTLVVFGDSLSDSGNSGSLTGGGLPPPPYFQNRFSNGKVAVEYLWDNFNPGTPTFKPSLQGGTNYAIGGATTGQENNQEVGNYPQPIFANRGNAWQLNSFKNSNPTFNPATSLFSIWLFPNDVFYYRSTGGSSAGTYDGQDGTPIAFDQIPVLAVDNILGTIDELVKKGARNFLVMNSPDLSKTPAFLNTPLAPTMAKVSKDFNDLLRAEVAQLSASSPSLDIRLFSTDQALNDIISNPGALGFTNITQPCFTGTSVCSDPSSYLYWDTLHPTTRTHAILAQGMANTVPAPLPVLGGCAVLGWSRRLRRRLRQIA
ncbi:MAG: SGNH/GDSL hydrolase family protein [Cyanobacteriota bacterium]